MMNHSSSSPFLPRTTAASDPGPHRANNQDAYRIPDPGSLPPGGWLWVVADGVGGQSAGEVAAQLATQTVQEAYYQHFAVGHPPADALHHAITTANSQVYAAAQAQGTRMGCTIVAAVLHDGWFYLAHAGDARAGLLRGNRLTWLTRDHTWVQEQVSHGTLTHLEATRHEFRHVVLRVLGNDPTLAVESAPPQPVQPGDLLLLCSDGLYGTLNEKQIVALLRAGNDPARRLVAAAVQADAQDNITAVVAPLAPPPGGFRAITGRLGRPFPLIGMAAALLFLALLLWLLATRTPARPLLQEPPAPVPAALTTSESIATASPEPVATVTAAPGNDAVPVTLSPPAGGEGEGAVNNEAETKLQDGVPENSQQLRATVRLSVRMKAYLYTNDSNSNEAFCSSTEHELTDGTEVIILSNFCEPRGAFESSGRECSSNTGEWVQVKPVNSTVPEGWVLKNRLHLLQGGNPCLP